jgi:hypothetical protein
MESDSYSFLNILKVGVGFKCCFVEDPVGLILTMVVPRGVLNLLR